MPGCSEARLRQLVRWALAVKWQWGVLYPTAQHCGQHELNHIHGVAAGHSLLGPAPH